jgi:hypothetical protein
LPIYKVSKDRWKWRKKTEVSHPILKREEEEQPDSPLWINGKLGNPPIQEVRRERPEREVQVRTQRFIHARVTEWKKCSAVGSGLRVESLQMRGKLL